MNSPDAAEANTKAINKWLAGLAEPYALSSGKLIEQRRYALQVPAGILYLNGELVFPAKTCIEIRGATAGATYILGEQDYGPQSPGGPACQIVRLRTAKDTESDGSAIIRLCGAYCHIADLTLVGRRLPTDINSPEGPRTNYGIVIEGRSGEGSDPPSGNHTIENVSFIGCAECIYCSDKPVEHHADQNSFGRIDAYDFDVFFHSKNLQAVSQHFAGIVKLETVNQKVQPVAFWIERGGPIKAECVLLNSPNITLFKFGQPEPSGAWSQNTNRYEAWFRYDTPQPPRRPAELTLIDAIHGQDYPYSTRLSGLIAVYPTENEKGEMFDKAKLFRWGDKMAKQDDDVRCDVTNLPEPYAAKYGWGTRRSSQ